MRARSDRGICSAQSAGTRNCLLLHPPRKYSRKRKILSRLVIQPRGPQICAAFAHFGVKPPSAVSCQQHAPGYIRVEQLIVCHSAAEPQLTCSPVWYPPIPSTLAIPTERKASARSSRGPRHVRFFAFARVGVVGAH